METMNYSTQSPIISVLRPRDLKTDRQFRLTHLHDHLDGFRAALRRAWAEASVSYRVHGVLRFIHEHLFDDELNVAFIRTRCRLRNHNFSMRFKREVGLGMRRYIERQRMQAAASLLGFLDLPISDIAWAVGYTYMESFDRAFRRCYGCSPTIYRLRLHEPVQTNG